MYRKLKIFSFILFLVLVCSISNKVNAATLESTDLMKVGSGRYEIIIRGDTTIQDISNVLGEPKIVTPSAFGGSAYTFYTDSNYSNYLYIETTEENKIISYGSVDPTFETPKFNYGMDYDQSKYITLALFGELEKDSDKHLYGSVFYNKSALYNGNATSIINLYKDTYNSNPTKYLKGIVEHAVTMANAIGKQIGAIGELHFNEDFFYINEQLKENGSSIRTLKLGLEYISSLGIYENIDVVNARNYYVLNPLQFAKALHNNSYNDFSVKSEAIFDLDQSLNIIFVGKMRPDSFNRTNDVALTMDELTKLANGRALYKEAISNLSLEDALYTVEPQYSNISTLVAGNLVSSKKLGMLQYVNMIRAGAGIQLLEMDDDSYKTAQHISTLHAYRYSVLHKEIQHQPPKSDTPGISDEYWETAVGWGKGYQENLGRCGYEPTVSVMMRHINLFLDDSSEDGNFLSHRQKILDADFTKFGYGVTSGLFANEFSGYKANNVCLEAWPSAGVSFYETFINTSKFPWSAQFVDRYMLQDNSTVYVKNLRTNEEWSFVEQEHTSTRRFAIHTDNISSLNNRVIFLDTSMYIHPGDVFEITIGNVLDTNTNRLIDYTYRACIQYADESQLEGDATISIKVPDGISKLNKKYLIPTGKDIKLTAEIPDTVTNKKVTWTSSNPDAKITQNGTLYMKPGTYNEPVKITVMYDSTGVSDEIVISPYNLFGDATFFHPEDIILNEGDESVVQGIVYDPINPSGVKDVVYYLVDTKTNTRYEVTDEEISKEVFVDTNVQGHYARVWPIKANPNKELELRADIMGSSNNVLKTLSCKVKVLAPLTGIDLDTTLALKEGESSRLNLTLNPTNTTDQISIAWSSNNSNVASVDNSGNVLAKAKGTARITCTVTARGENSTNTFTKNLDVTVEEKEVVVLKGDMNTDGYINSTDAALVIDCFKNNSATRRDYELGDMDNNKVLNATDAAMIIDIFKSK